MFDQCPSARHSFPQTFPMSASLSVSSACCNHRRGRGNGKKYIPVVVDLSIKLMKHVWQHVPANTPTVLHLYKMSYTKHFQLTQAKTLSYFPLYIFIQSKACHSRNHSQALRAEPKAFSFFVRWRC